MIHYFQSVDSTMDAAFSLADSGELGIFDSVLAASQTRGRGQLRKRWTSLDGNLFASVRLPRSLPFNTSLGSIAVAAFIFPVLARYSRSMVIKWPNDIARVQAGVVHKIAGVLLEEKRGLLIAGIGVNIRAPEFPPDGESLPPAGLLAPGETCEELAPLALWTRMIAALKNSASGATDILWNVINNNLLWKNAEVWHIDGRERTRGILLGIGEDGAALLRTATGIKRVATGSLRPADKLELLKYI